jgi:hypothetical protein
MESFIEMNNQIIIIMSGILSVILLVPAITANFLTLAAPNAFGQQIIFGSIDNGSGRSASDTTSSNNMTDYNNNNIVIVSTTTGTNDNNATPSINMNETVSRITVHDVMNSTYIVPKEVNENESERRISKAIRDRINDVIHTIVMNNATIISTATITNSFVNESTTINNHTRLLEIIPDQVEVVLAGIRAESQPTNPLIELHTDIDTVCSANNMTLAECDMNIRIMSLPSTVTTEEAPEMNMTTTTMTNATTADTNATAAPEEEREEEQQQQPPSPPAPQLVL